MARYKVATEQGAEFANAELGAVVELDLDVERERALIAAGWLEAVNTEKEN